MLRGRPVAEDIEVACGRCGHTWHRQDRGCATCGGSTVVERDQFLSRNPRGNQTAVVARRLIRLCPTCDREALTEADARSGMVEEGYVSHYLIDTRTQSLPRAKRVGETSRDTSTPLPATPLPPARTPREPPPPASAPSGTTDPTLREAIASFLEGPAEPADALVMLLVGRDLGVTTRLSALGPDLLDRLERAGGGAPSASAGAARAVEHWRSRGWLPG